MSKMTKKIVSVLLSVLMVISMLPSFAVSAFAAEEKDHYLFAYFTGNDAATSGKATTQAIRFATSVDGLKFAPLNKNKPIITQTGGTLNCRDPYIFEGQDGAYYMVATDADYSDGAWGKQQKQIVFWKSTDLINWTDETYINIEDVYNNYSSETVTVWKAWAPEVFFDTETGKYMVYLAIDDGHNTNTMHYMLTDDLLDQSAYSLPQTLYAPADGKASIDGDIVEQDGVYYMFYKDEGQGTVSLVKADHAVGPYTYVGKMEQSAETGAIEGCQVYMIGDDYYLIADRYGDNGKFAIYNLGTDLSKLTAVDGVISVTNGNPVTTVDATKGFSNLSVRHGSILKITEAQADALNEAYPSTSLIKTDKIGLIAEYFTDSNMAQDHSGNGKNLTVTGFEWRYAAEHPGEWGNYGEDATFTNPNSNGYAKIDNIFRNSGVTTSTGFAVEFMGFVYNNEEARRYIDIGTDETLAWSSNGMVSDAGTYDSTYVFLGSGGKLGVKAKSSNWDVTTGNVASYYREWHKFLVVVEKDAVSYYCDGNLMATLDSTEEVLDVLIKDGDLKLGLSSFKNDPRMDGLMKNVRVYDHACTPTDLESVTRDEMIANNNENRIINAEPEMFTAPAWHGTSVATGAYSNVVWHANGQTAWGDEGSKVAGFKYNKIDMPNNLVLAYDGVNDVAQPVVFEWKTDGNSYMQTLFPNYNGVELTEFRSYWRGWTDADWNAFNYVGANEIVGYAAYHDKGAETKHDNKNTTRFMYNKLYYKGTGNTDTYYDKIQNLKFDLYAKSGNNSFGDNERYSKGLCYVLNYKPVYDILDAKDYQKIILNKSKYTAESYNTFYNAYKNLALLNVNAIFADATEANVESKVQQAANAIKSTVTAYNEAVGGLTLAVDMTAYDDAVAEANAILAQTDVYTAESLAAYEAAVNAAKAESFDTQEAADAAANAIISAKVKLSLLSADVKFYTVTEDGDPALVETKSNVAYGTKITLTNPSADKKVAKWTVTTQDGQTTTKLNTTADEISIIVTEPTEVYAVLVDAEEEVDPTAYSKVIFHGKNGVEVGYKYVEVGTTIVSSQFIGAGDVPFYTFTGWSQNYVTANGNDIHVYAQYEAAYYTPTCAVHLPDGRVKEYAYDSFVYLGSFSENKLALSKDGVNVLTYVEGDAFYAPHIDKIYVIVVDDVAPSIAITGSYKDTTGGKNAAAFNCKFFVPEGCEVVEYGMIFSTANGSIKRRAESASERGEYCMKITTSRADTTSFDGQAYLTYTDGVTTTTIYSAVVNQSIV